MEDDEFKVMEIYFQQLKARLMLLLNGILKTEIVLAKPYDTPILVITYGYLKYEYFHFLDIKMAKKLKKSIDKRQNYVTLESI